MPKRPDAGGAQSIDGTAVVVAITPVRQLDLATARDWRRWLARYVRQFDVGHLTSAELTRVAYVARIGSQLCEAETLEDLQDQLAKLEAT